MGKFEKIVLIIFFVLMVASPVNAESSKGQVLRVAYPIQENLTEIDENGNFSGYTYEYLQKIAQFTGWRYEFIVIDEETEDQSLMTALKMVQSGEADIIGAMLKSDTLEKTYQYCQNSYGVVNTTLSVIESNIAIDETNFLKQSPLRVAVLEKATTRNTELAAYLKNNGAEYELINCQNIEDQIEMLKEDKADALLRVSLSFVKGTRGIAEFSPRPFYFAASQGKTAITASMDNAIEKITETDPYFQKKLYDKFFGDTSGNFYVSDSEKNYIKNNSELKVLLIPDIAPFVFRNNKGAYGGIAQSVFDNFCEMTGFTPNYTIYDYKVPLEEVIASKQYDCILGLPNNSEYAATTGMVLSQPYMEVEMTQFYNTRKTDKEATERTLALLRGTDISGNQPYKEVIYYDKLEDCLKAVSSGKADFGYANSYSVEHYFSSHLYANLATTPLPGSTRKMSFALTERDDITLLGLANRYIRNLQAGEVNAYYIEALNTRESNDIIYFIKKNPLLCAVSLLVFLLLVMVVVSLFLVNRANRKKNLALERVNAAKTEFLSRMSHEIRTPINAVIGVSELASEEVDNPEEIKKSLAEIKSSGDYLLGLVNDILDMAKIESRKIELHPENVQMDHFFQEINSIILPPMKRKNIQYYFSTDLGDITHICFDSLRCKQIFINLLSNAYKFTPEGGCVKCQVSMLRKEDGSSWMHISIEDNGIGMQPSFLEKSFIPFEQEQVGSTTTTTGTGLGLAIVKNLVTLMDGSISVESQLNKGTKFVVELPNNAISEAEITAAASCDTATTEISLEGIHVLLVEDHPLNAKISRKMLEKVGVIVDHAENGVAAIEMFEAATLSYYQVILMDIRMPEMDGLEATQRIRSMSREDAKEVIIIAMSANAFDEDVTLSLKAGMNAHLAKPVKPNVLYDMLKKHLSDSVNR